MTAVKIAKKGNILFSFCRTFQLKKRYISDKMPTKTLAVIAEYWQAAREAKPLFIMINNEGLGNSIGQKLA